MLDAFDRPGELLDSYRHDVIRTDHFYETLLVDDDVFGANHNSKSDMAWN